MRPAPICAAVLALALAACQPARPDAPAAVAAAADDNLNAVLWVQRSAEYRATAAQTYRAATARLDEALGQADWNALVPAEREGSGRPQLKPAVVLDIDETVLDNSPYQARLVRDGGEYSDPSW